MPYSSVSCKKSVDFHSKSGDFHYFIKKSGDLPPNREIWKLCMGIFVLSTMPQLYLLNEYLDIDSV